MFIDGVMLHLEKRSFEHFERSFLEKTFYFAYLLTKRDRVPTKGGYTPPRGGIPTHGQNGGVNGGVYTPRKLMVNQKWPNLTYFEA